jgi:two-component sensor histidine kinase
MENLLIALLPTERYSTLFRYFATAAIVGIVCLLRISLEQQLGSYPLLLFFPAIFLSALLFNRGSGYLATFLSTGLAIFYFVPPRGAFAVETSHILPLLLFVGIGLTMASVVESLRQAVQKLARAEQQKTLLLEELAHRNRNDLNMITSLLSLQARSQSEPRAQAALDAAVSRIQVLAKAQDRLNGAVDGGLVEVSSFLEALCADLGNLMRDVRPIVVRVHADRYEAPSSQAVAIGLVVNELVTNAFKYAFPADRGGIIDVTLTRSADRRTISVSDDGVGCAENPREGLGSRIVRLLVRQLNGTVERHPQNQGCTVRATIEIAH